MATTTEDNSYYSVDCSSSTSAPTKVIYYGTTAKNTFAGQKPILKCSRCDALIETGKDKYNKFEISNNTATSNNFTQVFFYCNDCMRWMRRKRWIRLLDNQKHYGKY